MPDELVKKPPQNDPIPDSPQDAGRVDFPTYRRGPWWPAFLLLGLPFIFVFKMVLPAVRGRVNWRAVAGTIVVFELFMLCAEHYDLKRGHWVYNQSRILGPTIFHIPIEEPLLYYWFPPLLTIVMMVFFKKMLERKGL